MAWLGTKTFINSDTYEFGDLNRINENIEYMVQQLALYGYGTVLVKPTKKTYTRLDMPTVEDINNARENVNAMVAKFPTIVGTPVIVVILDRIQSFDYIEANKLEQNLQSMKTNLDNAILAFRKSGTFKSGTSFNF